MEELTPSSFHFVTAGSNEEFILGDPIDPFSESQNEKRDGTSSDFTLRKMSTDTLEVNHMCSKDNLKNMFTEDMKIKSASGDLLPVIKKEENDWDIGYLENLLDSDSTCYDTKDKRNWDIQKGEVNVLSNLVGVVNNVEIQESKPSLKECSSMSEHPILDPSTSNKNNSSEVIESEGTDIVDDYSTDDVLGSTLSSPDDCSTSKTEHFTPVTSKDAQENDDSNFATHSNELNFIDIISSSEDDSDQDVKRTRKRQKTKQTRKIKLSHTNLITMAMLATTENHITASEIFEYISRHFPEVTKKRLNCDLSIAEYLSKSKYFVKLDAPSPNSNSFWTLNPSTERKLRIKLKGKAEKIQLNNTDSHAEELLYGNQYFSKLLWLLSSTNIFNNINIRTNKRHANFGKGRISKKCQRGSPAIDSKDSSETLCMKGNRISNKLHTKSCSNNSIVQLENHANNSQGNNLYLNTVNTSTATNINEIHMGNILRHVLPIKTPMTNLISEISSNNNVNLLNNKQDLSGNKKNNHQEQLSVNNNEDPFSLKEHESILSSYDYIYELHKYECKICKKIFDRKANVIKHLEGHSNYINHACNICCKAFRHAATLKYHMESFHSTFEIKCPMCEKVCQSNMILKVHIKNCHLKKRTKISKICNICQKTLSSAERLKSHMKAKHGYDHEPFICNDCSASFYAKYLLVYHIKSNHLPPEYKCSKCPALFNTYGQRKTHLHKEHMETKIKKFVCEYCGARFSFKEGLSQHILIHTDEKPFSCEECGKCFRTISNLQQHSITHSDKRPFSCDLCNKAFRIRNHLKQHMSVHGMVSTSSCGKKTSRGIKCNKV